MIAPKYIDKMSKDHKFSVHYLCKTLIVFMILISLSGCSLSCSVLPNRRETGNKESINNERIEEKEEIVDRDYHIFAFNAYEKSIYLLTFSKDKKIVINKNTGLVGEIDGDPKITSDREKVLFSFRPRTERHHRYLYIMNIDGTKKINLTKGMWLMYGASLSPDGKKVAFIGEEEVKDSQFSLWIVNIDGTERIDLLEGMEEIKKGINGQPVFSPDGRKILFNAFRDESGIATSYLYMFDLDKKKVVTIVKDSKGLIREYFFSPDSKKVLFEFIPGYTYFYPALLEIINIDGTERKNIAEGLGVKSVVISPDGKKVAFIGRKSGYSPDFVDSPNPSLCLVNTDGTEIKNLLKGMGIKGDIREPPVFSPDGRKILFILEQFNAKSLCKFDLDRDKIITLVEAEDIKSNYQFSSDGRKILLEASFKGDEVYYFIGTDDLTGQTIYTKYTSYRHFIINSNGNDGFPKLSLSIEDIILNDICYATWIPKVPYEYELRSDSIVK